MQDYSFCMKSEKNLDDEGTLPWFAKILNLGWASREASKIKKQGNFEKHDQLFTELGCQYLTNAFENYLLKFPGDLEKLDSTESAQELVLRFLNFSKIEIFFSDKRVEDEEADDLLTYVRDFCSRLVLSLVIDRCEKLEDPLGLRAIRRILIPYFLNRKSQVQDSKVNTHK